MARAKVKLNSKGVKQLLGDPGVRRELTRVAERVQRAVPGAKIEQATTAGYRAVVHVVDDRPGALAREARDGKLVNALHRAGR